MSSRVAPLERKARGSCPVAPLNPVVHVAIDWKMENLLIEIWFLIIQLKKVRWAV